jgi:hypothetical protein
VKLTLVFLFVGFRWTEHLIGMSTVAEITDAVKRLPLRDKLQLLETLGRTIAEEQLHSSAARLTSNQQHSALEIPTVSVTAVFEPDFKRADLLDEMLEIASDSRS